MTIDVDTGIDEFFKAAGSSEAQRADAIAVLKDKCGMVGGIVTLIATGETLDSEKSKAWIAEHKPHLLPPIYERSLADRAFLDGNITARGALVKQIGKAEADKLAQQYGLHSVSDTRPGTAPAGANDGKQKPNGKEHASNPFHKSNWNVSKQGSLLRAVGVEKCAAIAASVGCKIGSTAPNPNF
jgi:hypothetical protein